MGKMSSITITKSPTLLVGPSEPTPSGTVKLTGMDMALSALPMAALFAFERPIDQPAETIRKALSQSLVLYYPIAGRLVAAVHDGIGIACTGDGVAFVAASASCGLREAMLLDEDSSSPAISLDELTVTFKRMYMEMGDSPLVMTQVTEFACGGFVVSVTWNHAVADGVGMAQFLRAVGEVAGGGSSPTVIPVRWDSSLPELPPAIVSSTAAMVSCQPGDYVSSHIKIPMSFINRVKSEFSHVAPSSPSPCSVFEVVVAAIWKCRARATMSIDGAGVDDPVALVFTANVRKQAQAKPGYYGNCFGFQTIVATRGEVANGGVVELVKRVKEAKERIPYTFEMAGGGGGGDRMMQEVAGVRQYDTLYVSSWWGLGFDDVDFGGGTAARVMYNLEWKVVPSCFLCGKKGKDGVGAMAFCVELEHAVPFHVELGRLGEK
uniref:Uncharacterized protein n=1 Tax=Leersia perrieri TaxID=77586 RepID=A0A0D9W2C0_9ORYZ